ncbi:chalcone isomerase-like protein [Desulfobotulus alkaliphilus]|uniref:Chalcone isomerase-like protein n=1 Tax=Desulfobotulus alkaliphilus TaxID=622671 RepID=A0A562S7B8_9BACT|nr:chalcone isomerase family protein [Desulfobotulus alkaliphilus]TWI77319.1 chalcone isomerase-like protein [Desulfobotulus alkaliphilus]
MKKILVFLTVCLMAMPAMATLNVRGVDLPTSITLEEDTLVLNGAGTRRRAMMNLYVGALYLQEKNSNATAIINADASMSIRLHITSGMITRERMLDAINEGFEAATGGNTAPIQTQIDILNGFFSDEIKEGDLIELAYTPTRGVIMSKNGATRGSIEGLDFKKALFAIWLGDKPADNRLKRDMLN